MNQYPPELDSDAAQKILDIRAEYVLGLLVSSKPITINHLCAPIV